MEDFGVKTLSETIGTLIRLRYLGLRNNYIQEIPHSFRGLEKLEVLDIAQNFMVELPDIINEMSSLRYLYMSDVIHRKPLKVDVLQNLERLSYISIYDWRYEVSSLEKMSSLFELDIEEVDENSDVNKLFASVAMFERLVTSVNSNSRLPSAINTCLEEDPMLVLQGIPSLSTIRMRNAYIGRQMVFGKDSFSELCVLCINEMWNLSDIRFNGATSLKELEIKNCPFLYTLPKEIESMLLLKKLKIVTTNRIAKEMRKSSLFSNILEVDISP
ncbi:disease resistance protein RPH8A-like [Salvia hispanica]|uniref:disease resistance protein RPH8A-like n=1 Tax=Salvia hispanica TaxID=49212 RepID=UPI0020090867|nr:disease resistance protein RPH8A-like [Salvia hispanica]